MNFTVKKHSKEHFFDTYIKWCIEHKFPTITIDWFPENVFVSYNENDEPCYCCWFWHTDSKLAWIGFPCSNKQVKFRDREGGLDALYEYISKYAKKKNYTTIITTSGREETDRVCKNTGYVLGDENVNHYLKNLK